MTDAYNCDNKSMSLVIGKGKNYTIVGSTVVPANGFTGVLSVSLQVATASDTTKPVIMKITVGTVAITTTQNAVPTVQFGAVPNPVPAGAESVTLAVPQDIRGIGTCLIFDPQGNLIDEQEFVLGDGRGIIWDLTNKHGVKVGAGAYAAVLKIEERSGKRSVLKTVIGVQR